MRKTFAALVASLALSASAAAAQTDPPELAPALFQHLDRAEILDRLGEKTRKAELKRAGQKDLIRLEYVFLDDTVLREMAATRDPAR